ncbi:MAG: hypothetical protein JXR25_12970 [Pontiellaceae bacterium]|nr:hypothetical protein [Pontiellaceae bacterium]MBN2785727.1 hypothetical protein [Pontiellaceae bacterium]
METTGQPVDANGKRPVRLLTAKAGRQREPSPAAPEWDGTKQRWTQR